MYRQAGYRNVEFIYNLHDIQHYRNLSEREEERHFESWSEAEEKFIAVGRLTEAKAFWHLLRAFKVYVEQHPKAVLLILGDGEYRQPLERLIDDLVLGENVLMPGIVANVFPYLKQADATLVTSYTEALPNIIIESLAVGTPVLSTDCISGPREVLAPNLLLDQKIAYPYKTEFGYLAEPFDMDVDFSTKSKPKEVSYAEAIGKIHTNTFDSEELKNRAMDFDKETILSRWQKVFNLNNLEY
jgi:glycosyltransferase involved in cell wall biosynthesis